ncbi:MAG: hypothetical protein GXP27_12785, partial [Planctomycetes bacterium]|nr:hypothetical protein [Planctomycetota bacterium]
MADWDKLAGQTEHIRREAATLLETIERELELWEQAASVADRLGQTLAETVEARVDTVVLTALVEALRRLASQCTHFDPLESAECDTRKLADWLRDHGGKIERVAEMCPWLPEVEPDYYDEYMDSLASWRAVLRDLLPTCDALLRRLGVLAICDWPRSEAPIGFFRLCEAELLGRHEASQRDHEELLRLPDGALVICHVSDDEYFTWFVEANQALRWLSVHGLPIPPQLAAGPRERTATASAGGRGNERAHGVDYRSVLWDGDTFTFTPLQAACVKILWEHREQGTPEVGEQTILTEADSDSNRLLNVFERGKHPAWGTLIVPGTRKGTFRLAD